MSKSTMNQRLQNDVVWFPQAGSVMLDCIMPSELRDEHARHLHLGERLGILFNTIVERLRAYLRARSVRAQLLGLDERLLDDIGITRGDIEAIAQGTYKPAPSATVHVFTPPADDHAGAEAVIIDKHAA
ncbi:MAG: DUF1127 domain-containing protein [Rhodospirillaceae bacterium]